MASNPPGDSTLVAWTSGVDELLRAGAIEDAWTLAQGVAPGIRSAPQARLVMAEVAMFRGDLDFARAELRAVLEVAPHFAAALHDLGTLSLWTHDYTRAAALFRASLASWARMPAEATDSAAAKRTAMGLAHALMAMDQYREGWRWREIALGHDTNQRPRGLWNGSPLGTGTLAVFAEEGLGDVLQFCRYVRELRPRVGRLYLVLDGYHAPLIPLLASLEGVDVIVPDRKGGPAINAYCAVLTLAAIAGASTAHPGNTPYLAAPAERVALWRARLPTTGVPRVGLVWAGHARPDPAGRNIGGRRSIEPALMRPLLGVAGIEWHLLQVGGKRDLESFAGDPQPIDHGPAIRDFADTAALIEQLDLLIAIDTSIVHVAGAIGAPVWMLNRYDTCWRWGATGETTPWYPSMRIFRQPSFGDWPGAIALVAAALAQWRDALGWKQAASERCAGE